MSWSLSALVVASVTAGAAPVDFDTQIVPILTRAGCNAGACHGAAAGRGGFHLSLYGSDPARDYEAIVHELEGRRVNLARPDESLVLLKPAGWLAHGGGIRLDAEGPETALLERWIAEGARRLRRRRLAEFRVEPRELLLAPETRRVGLRARAVFDSGEREDVTAQTVFTAADPSSVRIDADGRHAEILRSGRHVVVARYLDRVVPLVWLAPPNGDPVELADEPRFNFVDEEVLATLSAMRIEPAPLCDDATFLRRVRLDLTGRLPSPQEVRAFVEDRTPRKRERLVERLLASDDCTDYWTWRFANLLRIRAQPNDREAAEGYHRWLRGRLAEGAGLDRIARELLLAEGDTHENPPANFYRTVSGPRELAEFVAETFMAVRLRCANCHDHPLDRWTQDDYHGLAALFAGVEQGRVVRFRRRGTVTHPRTGEPARRRLPGDRFLPEEAPGRESLAAWLTDPGNPYFARAMVNRLWQAVFGYGLVEPVDDLRETNPPIHPRLLDRLAEDFVTHGYDWRRTLRILTTSATYGRQTAPGGSGDLAVRLGASAAVRRLPAEVLADAIADVTGVAERYPGQPPGTRAVQLPDPGIRSESLDILGRCNREDACESSAGAAGGLSAKLHLLNGPLLNARLTAPDGRLNQLIKQGRTNEAIVEEFYMRAYGRQPTSVEAGFWSEQIGMATTDEDRLERLEDFLWSLLCSREFVTNH